MQLRKFCTSEYTSGCCRSDLLDEATSNKRKRFTDEQLAALTDLAEEANWSLLSVAKEAREQFCTKYEISKVRRSSCFRAVHHLQ